MLVGVTQDPLTNIPKEYSNLKHNRSLCIFHSLNTARWVLLVGMRALFHKAMHGPEWMKAVPALTHSS